MAYPNLYKDESKILETQNIKVKSVSFEAVLTTRRLVLVDSKKRIVPPQEILLATLKNVDTGENAIRDPTITLSIITNTGTTRQMILTFSKTSSGGERKRECDDWVRALRQQVSQTIEHPILPDIPSLDEQEPLPVADNAPAQMTPPPPPRIEIVNAPLQKKRIEISRPMKKIIESAPDIPRPVETSSLPTGSFCNRCGSRVPPESAFCNRCGTPVVKDSDLDAIIRQPVSPQPVFSQPVPAHVPPEPPAAVPDPAPAPEVPQVAVPLPPAFGLAADKKERPIEDVIHSIEPLIEDSVPRTEPAPLVPRPASFRVPEPVVSEPVIPKPESMAPEGTVQWPVIAPSVPLPGSPADVPGTPPQPATSGGVSGRGRVITIAVIVVIVLAALAGVFIFANPLSPGSSLAQTPAPTVAPVTTAVSTTVPVTTTAPVITTATPVITPITSTATAEVVPPAGVWVHINYINQFSGTYGTPNSLSDVSSTGDKYYRISTSTGTVTASIQKDDGSADPLTVEVYKDGELVTKKSTVTPKGTVEIQVNLKPAPTPAPVQTLLVTTVPPVVNSTAATNATVNATVTG
jgi:hypothetical protein